MARSLPQQLELAPIEYHVAYYPLVVDADWTEFQKFSDDVGDSSDVPNYSKFSTNRSRIEIVRELVRILRKEFYYALAFDRGGGGFFLDAQPKACLRASKRLSATDQADMMKCFDEVTSAIEAKADLKYKADEKRQLVDNQ